MLLPYYVLTSRRVCYKKYDVAVIQQEKVIDHKQRIIGDHNELCFY